MNELSIITSDDVANILAPYEEDFLYFGCGQMHHKNIINPQKIHQNSAGIAAKLNEKVMKVAIENIKLKTKLDILEQSKNHSKEEK